jgi:hypothetical protein
VLIRTIFRLGEFKQQVEAIKRGLATIVPLRLLPLFTWQELEMMVPHLFRSHSQVDFR